MKKYFLSGLIALLQYVAFAEISEHACSGLHTSELLDVPTHIRDSSLFNYDVNYYCISLEVSDSNTYIDGYTDIGATALQHFDELVFELSTSLQVDSVFFGEQVINSFTHVQDLISFTPAVALEKDELFMVRIYYHGESGQNGFYSGISNRIDVECGSRVTYTLSEPFRALDWFVCKQVLHDKADSADIYLTVGENLMAGSNGVLVKVDSMDGKMVRYHWRSRYPIAYYLLSLSVSDYQEYSFYTTLENHSDSLLIQNYIYNVPGYLEKVKAQIDETANMIHLYSRLFTTYPFWKEKYGHCLAPMGGGMEHQTMTTLSNFNFNLVAHELTHQWFGDNVTCASWQDIWVNEGFASYGEYLAIEELISGAEADLWMSNAHAWALTEPMGSVYIPVEDAGDENRIFSTALSYKKGASLLHMIRYELDDDSLFFKTLSDFQNLYTDSIATGMDFMKVLNQTSGSDFKWFFDQWYFGQGYPSFQFAWWQTSDSVIIEIRQSGSSDQTPFFRGNYDIALQFETGMDTVIRVLMDQPFMNIKIPVKGRVINLVPDPENWVLEKSQVFRKSITNGYFSVNPNPFNDRLNIVFNNGDGKRKIILSDLSGKILEKKESSHGTFTINTHNLRQGLYLLQVKDGKESYTAKVVKQ